jgi:hypothetical protein
VFTASAPVLCIMSEVLPARPPCLLWAYNFKHDCHCAMPCNVRMPHLCDAGTSTTYPISFAEAAHGSLDFIKNNPPVSCMLDIGTNTHMPGATLTWLHAGSCHGIICQTCPHGCRKHKQLGWHVQTCMQADSPALNLGQAVGHLCL